MPTQYCTTHKDRETLRICGRCERPFCPDCLMTTPVGGRCRECARGPKIARLRVPAWRWPLVVLTAVFGALIATAIVSGFGFLGVFLGYAAGLLIGGGVLAASGRKPGRALAIVTVVSIIVGAYLATPAGLVSEALRAAGPEANVPQAFTAGLRVGLLDIWTWIMAIVMSFGAINRVR